MTISRINDTQARTIPHPLLKFWRVPLPEKQSNSGSCQDIHYNSDFEWVMNENPLHIFSSKDVKTRLQRLSGKYASFALAVRGLASINEIKKGVHSSRLISVWGSLKEEIQRHVPTPVTFNHSAIDHRINFLQSNHLSTAYSKQKQSLKIEFESFLFVFPGEKNLFDTTPLDVCHFLVFNDSKGKTQVHKPGCPISLCQCPF